MLWNSKRREAGAVIYRRNRASRIADLTWRGTWDLKFSQGVVDDWQKAVGDSYLQVWYEKVYSGSEILSYSDAVDALRLPARTIDPLSLQQMRWERYLEKESESPTLSF